MIKALPSIQIPDKDNITDVDDSDIIINTFTSNDLYCSTIEDFDLEKTSHHSLPNSNFPEYVDQDGIEIEMGDYVNAGEWLLSAEDVPAITYEVCLLIRFVFNTIVKK